MKDPEGDEIPMTALAWHLVSIPFALSYELVDSAIWPLRTTLYRITNHCRDRCNAIRDKANP